MISIVRREYGGGLEETTDLSSLGPWLAKSESRLWVNVGSPSVEEIEEVGRQFGFHPLTIEDCLHGGQRPKLEDYDGYLFLVLHALPQALEDPCVVEDLDEIYIYVTNQAFVTIHRKDADMVTKFLERIQKEPALLARPPGALLHIIADHVVDEFFPFLDRVEEEIDLLEDEVLTSAHPALLHRLFTLKRTLIHVRKSLSPLREIFNGLSRRDYPLLDSKTALYFRDIYDHLIRASEIIDTCRDLVATTVEAYLSATSNRMNEVMKQLAIIATIFLPLSFITGFFGMNFEQIPWKNPALLIFTIVVLLAIPVLMLLSFARRGWLHGGPARPQRPETQQDRNRKDLD